MHANMVLYIEFNRDTEWDWFFWKLWKFIEWSNTWSWPFWLLRVSIWSRHSTEFLWSFMWSQLTWQGFRTCSSTSKVLMWQFLECGDFSIIATIAVWNLSKLSSAKDNFLILRGNNFLVITTEMQLLEFFLKVPLGLFTFSNNPVISHNPIFMAKRTKSH